MLANSTAFLKAPKSAVSCIFSLPPEDSRCLDTRKFKFESNITITSTYSVDASWSNRYTRACGPKSIVSMYSYAPVIRSWRARPLSIFRVEITWKRLSQPTEVKSNVFHILWYDVVNSSPNIEFTTASMSLGWGLPVQLYTSSSLVTSYAAWQACRTLRARRMSPLDSFRRACMPSGVMFTLVIQ